MFLLIINIVHAEIITEFTGIEQIGQSGEIICPECGKSKGFDVGMSTTTLMGVRHYIDENGKECIDDPNITTTEYKCWDCGHVFEINSTQWDNEIKSSPSPIIPVMPPDYDSRFSAIDNKIRELIKRIEILEREVEELKSFILPNLNVEKKLKRDGKRFVNHY